MKKYLLILLVVITAAVSGCSQVQNSPESSAASSSPSVSESSSPEASEPPSEVSESSAPVSSSESEPSSSEIADTPQTQTVTLYIGMDGNFTGYPVAFDGDISTLTPEFLIQSISDLTGWDLSLADEVTTGKGGMTVCFSSECALFTGPPDPQNEEFFVYDSYQLAQTILDSIQYTLQYNFVDPTLGDPSSLPIYYCMEDNQPLTLESLNITFPLDEPYPGWPKG